VLFRRASNEYRASLVGLDVADLTADGEHDLIVPRDGVERVAGVLATVRKRRFLMGPDGGRRTP
jgi:hypothetical protein